MASVTVLAIVGVVFEIGRRLGRSKEQRNTTETDLKELEQHIDEEFEELERKLDRESAVREKEHGVVIDWIGDLTDALKEEGYDVQRPDEVSEDINVGGGGSHEFLDDD